MKENGYTKVLLKKSKSIFFKDEKLKIVDKLWVFKVVNIQNC